MPHGINLFGETYIGEENVFRVIVNLDKKNISNWNKMI